MDPQVQASFIPKKPLDTGVRGGGGGAGLFFLLTLLIFVASLVAAGASFAYQQYLTKAISDASASLKLSENAYDPSAIQDLLRLDTRINQAQTLIGKHAAASAVFNFLSTQTLQNVAFSNFTYDLQADGSAHISLSGIADNFSTVALQSDQFGGCKLLKNVVFSSITVDSTGRINFSVSADVNPSLINYANSLQSNPSVATCATAPQATGAATPSTSSGQATTTP